MITVQEQSEQLLAILRAMPGAAIALSGGVDSSVVAMAAQLALGERAVAITADSPSVPRAELAHARQVAEHIGIRHLVIPTHEYENPLYIANDGHRCYHCKSELYSRIEQLLPQLQLRIICSGANRDDQGDYRPGLKAAQEHRVRHPLMEAGFGKAEVRALARYWGLPVWDKPASPCLASRVAPGLAATPERLARIEQAEAYLKSLGLPDCRVRCHDGELARIEVAIEMVPQLASEPIRSNLTRRFQEIGFQFITLDLMGFRSGSMNNLIALDVRARYTATARSQE